MAESAKSPKLTSKSSRVTIAEVPAHGGGSHDKFSKALGTAPADEPGGATVPPGNPDTIAVSPSSKRRLTSKASIIRDKEKDKDKDKEKDKDKDKDKEKKPSSTKTKRSDSLDQKPPPPEALDGSSSKHHKPRRSSSMASLKKHHIDRKDSGEVATKTVRLSESATISEAAAPTYPEDQDNQESKDGITKTPKSMSGSSLDANANDAAPSTPSRATDTVTRRKSSKKLTPKTKPLKLPAPSNRTVGGEILQFSLVSSGYWAEAFSGSLVPPQIDDLFAIADARRDALLFPLQNFNNHYEYHTIFASVPHVNFLGIDNNIGPILISITQEAFMNDSISPRSPTGTPGATANSSGDKKGSNTPMNRQLSATSLKGPATGDSLGANPRAPSMFSPLSPRTESQRVLRLPSGWGSSGSSEKTMEKQHSATSLSTLLTPDSLGYHRALIRTKLGDYVVRIPAIHTKRKYPKGHTLLNALMSTMPAVPFEWDKVEFKETNLAKEKIEAMELKLVPKHYKFGVIFAKSHQATDDEFLNNPDGSEAFDKFMSTLGKKVELKGWKDFTGGLDVSHGQTGRYSYYTRFRDYEIMFHVSTLLPHVPGDEQQLEKKRHIGNDVCVIVFQDGDTPISPSTIQSYFNHSFIIVHPLRPEEQKNNPLNAPLPKPIDDPVMVMPVTASSFAPTSLLHGMPPERETGHTRYVSESVGNFSPLSSPHDLDEIHGAHSPSSPTLLHRLGTDHSGNVSPSRRSPGFHRAMRSSGGQGGSPPGRAASMRESSPLAKYNTVSSRHLTPIQDSEDWGSGFNNGGVSPGRRERLASVTIGDARSAESRSGSSDDHPLFMDPVSMAAMPSPNTATASSSHYDPALVPTPRTDDMEGDAGSHTNSAATLPLISTPTDDASAEHGSLISPGSQPHSRSNSRLTDDGDDSTSSHKRVESDSSGSSGVTHVTTSATTAPIATPKTANATDDEDSNAASSTTPPLTSSMDEDEVKRSRLQRRMSMGTSGSAKLLVKSNKSTKLSHDMIPKITRAKLNVAAKERQTNPPVQFRVEVVNKDGVSASEPKLPAVPIFMAGPYFREWMLTKLVNSERASYFSKHFAKPIERTREALFAELLASSKN